MSSIGENGRLPVTQNPVILSGEKATGEKAKLPLSKDDNVLTRLENLCKSTSPVTKKQIEEYVAKGEELARKICGKDIDPIRPEMKTKENAQAIVWLMMAMAASDGKEYISGIFRIEDPEGKLYAFLNNCKDEVSTSYGRISTHFGEHKDFTKKLEGEKQRGLDMGDHLLLPAGKRTILFSQLPDGTTFVKPEGHGFPPCWKNGFIKQNFFECIGHAVDYLKSRPVTQFWARQVDFLTSRGTKKAAPTTFAARREAIDKADKKTYKKALSILAPGMLKTSFLGKLALKIRTKLFGVSATQREVNAAAKLGISAMVKVINEQIAKFHEQSKTGLTDKELVQRERRLAKLDRVGLQALDSKIQADKKKGYELERQGDEVTLPSFSKFF